jgi:hypothetical protein
MRDYSCVHRMCDVARKGIRVIFPYDPLDGYVNVMVRGLPHRIHARNDVLPNVLSRENLRFNAAY